MTLLVWDESNRSELGETLPQAMVLLAVGATEQHGPHLATGTDALVATEVTRRAAALAHERCARPLVLAPPLPFGASDHHLPFGGTLSLTPETLQAVLLDLCRSIAADGGHRLVLVNGHGGNTGVCHAAAAAASVRFDLAVAYLDYWQHAPAIEDVFVPGHAGEFETSLVLGLHPDRVGKREPRDVVPDVASVNGTQLHSAEVWAQLDGYTDRPERADAERGRKWLEAMVAAVADRLVELGEVL